jgi:hypothetical protein
MEISSATYWDSAGNSCRYQLYHIAPGVFELWIHPFNKFIPCRFMGSIGVVNARLDAWIAARKEAGFAEAAPDCNLCPIA